MRQSLVKTSAVLLALILVMSLGQCTRADRALAEATGQGSIAFLSGDKALGIPFKIVDELIVISARLNDSAPLNLYLDTGFGSPGVILFDPRLGQKLGLRYVTAVDLGGGGNKGGNRAGVAVGASLTLPGVRIVDQQVMVLSGNAPFASAWADGAVGASLFGCVVEIDYDNQVLNLYEEVPQRVEESSERFDLSFTQGIPVVEAQVTLDSAKTIPVKLVVDTGAGLPLFLFTYSNSLFVPPRAHIAAKDEGLSGVMAYVAGRVPTLSLGKFTFSRPLTVFLDKEAMGPATVLGQDGFLGLETQRNFNVVFDYAGERMFLDPNSKYGTGYDFNMAGLVLRTRRDGTIVVFDVVANSPAAQEGVRAGDLIVAINDKAAGSISADEVSRLFVQQGKTVKLTVERNSRRLDFTLALRRII